ncbi:MAG: hypothetical protein IKD63_01600 [Oscillospiraceae bacterium]|nr:hypothetical protein [Oscillospiraceae bacterium]MBR7189786.1 hypothetical protein [Oscillospiraceae bacterium]
MEDEKKTVQEISDEALDQVAGGFGGKDNPCPDCGSKKYARFRAADKKYVCPDCGHVYGLSFSKLGFF